MRIDLDGKTAFVSGSTQGIGRSIASRLAECGAVVHVNGRSRERVDAAVAELRSEQPDARFEAAAVDVVTDADALFAALPEVDILVNNLGIFGPMPLLEVDDAEWQRYWDVNVMSGIRLTRHYVRGMVARGPPPPPPPPPLPPYLTLPPPPPPLLVREHRPTSLIGRLIEPAEIANLCATWRRIWRRRRPAGRCAWTEGSWTTSCSRTISRGLSKRPTVLRRVDEAA